MPSRNVRKIYIAGGFYHVYNRGVEKRIIFTDDQDHRVFLNCLKEAVSKPKDPSLLVTSFSLKGETFQGVPHQPKNFYGKIDVIAYCLMSNHFHILLKQASEFDMKNFIQSVCTRYSAYFNKRHERVGSLFQGPYKAVNVDSEEYLLHLTRYIHRNPLGIGKTVLFPYSSYTSYIGVRKTRWVTSKTVLDFFARNTSVSLAKIHAYREYVEDGTQDETEMIGSLGIDNL